MLVKFAVLIFLIPMSALLTWAMMGKFLPLVFCIVLGAALVGWAAAMGVDMVLP